MVGHLLVPSLDEQISTFSPKIISQTLKDKLNFNGLVFTDALGMQALTKYYTNAQIAVKALQAGADILLCPVDVKESIDAIKKAINDKILTIEDIEQKVKKILILKKSFKNQDSSTDFLIREYAQELQQELYDQAITVVKNQTKQKLNDHFLQKSCFVNMNDNENILKNYLPSVDLESQIQFIQQIKNFNNCIFVLENLGNTTEKKNIINKYLSLEKLAKNQNKKVVLLIFDSPYCLTKLKSSCADIIIMGYENEPAMQKSAYKLLAGQIEAKGNLPISIN
jgi:beta-N-acetylhexosaminidase